MVRPSIHPSGSPSVNQKDEFVWVGVQFWVWGERAVLPLVSPKEGERERVKGRKIGPWEESVFLTGRCWEGGCGHRVSPPSPLPLTASSLSVPGGSGRSQGNISLLHLSSLSTWYTPPLMGFLIPRSRCPLAREGLPTATSLNLQQKTKSTPKFVCGRLWCSSLIKSRQLAKPIKNWPKRKQASIQALHNDPK